MPQPDGDYERKVELLEDKVRTHMQSLQDCSHDYAHIERVRKMSLHIASLHPEADQVLVELAAMCHDIGDAKYDTAETASCVLASCGFDKRLCEGVQQLVDGVSFRHELCQIEQHGWQYVKKNCPLELAIVQDADRLDAIGAIGIARCLAFSGKRNVLLYRPSDFDKPNGITFDQYSKCSSTAIGHFYEKLLTLKDRMKTPYGMREAEKRHQFTVSFLEQLEHEVC